MAKVKKNWYNTDDGWGNMTDADRSVRMARKEAVKSGAKFVQVTNDKGRVIGTVINNKKLGASFWNTTTAKGKSVSYVVAKDGSLVGYVGKKARSKVDRTIDEADYAKPRGAYKPRTSKKGRRMYDFAWDSPKFNPALRADEGRDDYDDLY